MKRTLSAIALMAFAVGGGTACATKKYVNTQVSGVDDKVSTLSQSVEETQQRQRQSEDKIAGVDQKVGQAQQSADQAAQSAQQANAKATEVAAKADELERASKRLTYTVTLDESNGNFKFNSAALPDEAKAKIDEMVQKIMADPQGAYFEIEGYTDSTGDKTINERIGMERAQAVRDYLYKEHHIPLHRMNVISYGEENPVAPNNTRDGRAQNRRVVIKVLV